LHVCGKKKVTIEEEGTPFTDAALLTPLELDKIIEAGSFKANTCFMRNQNSHPTHLLEVTILF